MTRFLVPLVFFLALIGTTAQAAFRRSDLESFQSLRDPFTPEVMKNLKHRPVSYFLENPPPVYGQHRIQMKKLLLRLICLF